MSGNPPIYSKRMVGKRFPATTVIKESTMKSPTKTASKSKQISSKSTAMPSAGLKKVGKIGSGKAMPKKPC